MGANTSDYTVTLKLLTAKVNSKGMKAFHHFNHFVQRDNFCRQSLNPDTIKTTCFLTADIYVALEL